MERREFVEAALALFTWTVLPEPVRESLFVWDDVTPALWFSVGNPDHAEPDWMKVAMGRYMNLHLYRPPGSVMITGVTDMATLDEYSKWWDEQQVPA